MKVTDNVYALNATKGNYAYLIADKEIVLVDTGRPGQGKGILKELESLNIKPKDIKHILLTHHDVDHIGNPLCLKRKQELKYGHQRRIYLIFVVKKNVKGLRGLFQLLCA